MGPGNIKKFELKLGKTALLIIIGGMAFLLCLSFVLGVGVGKNIDTYPEKVSSVPQQILALFWRPAKVASVQKSAATNERRQDKGGVDLAFHGALTSSKIPPMQPSKPVEKKQSAPEMTDRNDKLQPPTAVSPPQGSALSKAGTPDEKALREEKKSVKKQNQNKENAPAVRPERSMYVIFVTSLQDKSKIIQIHKTVTTMGYAAKIVRTDIPGRGTWYRVIATGFETKAQAQAAVDRISKKIRVKCIIRFVSANKNKNQ